MTNEELRLAVVAKGKTREGKNQYTQGAKRTQVGSGYSDCSSFVRWAYLQVLGVDIGLNTAAQITNKKLENVADVNQHGGKVPPESVMLPGDLIFFKGTDPSRPRGCGHVEMYIGNGKIIGHGSGVGPTVKSLSSYCTSRANSGKGWLCVLRVIPREEETIYPAKPDAVPRSDPAGQPEHGILITGGEVNLRTGPGTSYPSARTVKKGEVLQEAMNPDGWYMVNDGNRVLFVSPKPEYTKKV